MKTIPLATSVTLTCEEREDLEALAQSRKSEARIVLLAADGHSSPVIARAGGQPPLAGDPDTIAMYLVRRVDEGCTVSTTPPFWLGPVLSELRPRFV